MSFWNRLVCLVKGHETSLFPGIGAPASFAWTYPGAAVEKAPPVTEPKPVLTVTGTPASAGQFMGISGVAGISGPSRGGTGIHAVGGAGHGIVAHTGTAYNLDLCPRCLTLYVALPPPICVNCGTEKGLHKEFCPLPCQNCGKPTEAHIEGKCLFEASEYKGARWVENTRSACQ